MAENGSILLAIDNFHAAAEKLINARPFIMIVCDIPQGMADLWKGSQIVVCLHQRLKTLLLARLHWLYGGLLKVQSSLSQT